MKLADFPDVLALSLEDKLHLVDELWISLAKEIDEQEVTEEEKRILDERWEKYLQNPSSALTLDEIKAKLKRIQ